jgi:8-oxo-dGTP pyrophosphatase MutT (NUDIX family)
MKLGNVGQTHERPKRATPTRDRLRRDYRHPRSLVASTARQCVRHSAARKIGVFGGHREDNESFLECVAREIHEELSYFIPAKQFEFLARFEGTDFDVPGGALRSEFFVARDVPTDALIVTEGSLLIVDPDKVRRIEIKLTPSALFALNAFFA